MAKAFRYTYAVDGIGKVRYAGTRRFRVFGVVFAFSKSSNVEFALQEVVYQRALSVDHSKLWKAEGAEAIEQVDATLSRGVGFYVVSTLLDETDEQRTPIRDTLGFESRHRRSKSK